MENNNQIDIIKQILVENKNQLFILNKKPLYSHILKNYKTSEDIMQQIDYYNFLILRSKSNKLKKEYIIKLILLKSYEKKIPSNLYFIIYIFEKIIRLNEFKKKQFSDIIILLCSNYDLYTIMNNFDLKTLENIKKSF